MKIKLLHFGDLHLDAPFTSLSAMEGVPGRRRQELRLALARIVDLAAAEKADMVLVCGDLYEHGYSGKNTIHYIGDQFQKIRDIPVLIIPGNHDPAVPNSFYQHFDWPKNVRILGKSDFYEHAATGARVYGCLPPLESPDCSRINILMHHGTLDMPFSADAFQPLSSTEVDLYGFDYCAMGHFHTRLYGAGRKHRIYNPGSPEPLGFDEEGEHGVFITEIEKLPGKDSTVRAEFRRLNQRFFINLEVQAGGCLSDEQVAQRAADAMARGSHEDLYRITLHGYINRDYKISTSYIEECLKAKAFYIRLIDQTEPDYDFGLISREQGLRGLFAKKMLERAARAVDEEERRLIMQALYYGMEAIDEGTVCI